jgi:glycine/D-amino acid oxidase-like deaminating enzyme
MLHAQSPWLYELKNRRKPYALDRYAVKNDIAIIGGGIAGVVTAYYVLTLTKKSAAIFEGNKIASGATGHNAGQLTSYLEKPFEEIVEEYGEALALEGQKDINSGWTLLRDIKEAVRLKTSLYIFEGLSGCTSIKPVYTHLENRYLRPPVGHQTEFCLIADDCPFLKALPPRFADLYTIVPRRVILDLLETMDGSYCAAFTARKGCMNSAMFCEEVLAYLLNKYRDRFHVYEAAAVSEIELNRGNARIVLADRTSLSAGKVILCTNGFRGIKIVNRVGRTISGEFHEALRGKIGFMKAYTFSDGNRPPVAISYYNERDNDYFYLTRRPSTFSRDANYNLVSVGGPEHFLADRSAYAKGYLYPEEVLARIDRFIQETRIKEFRKHYEHVFVWHGLMGYTKRGLRLIGPDKHNPVLIYNLGCNGVGIIPSVFGGRKVALFLNNQVHRKSIFDPYI